MAKHDDIFGEVYDPTGYSLSEYRHQQKLRDEKRIKLKKTVALNEVGEVPPLSPEIMERRWAYANNFVKMHLDVFPDSTGQKPFGLVQQKSISFGQDVFHKGGRLLKLEPRGYAKTTRICNEALFSVLAGLQRYIVILCSNLEKAATILDSIKTELYNNDMLEALFPGPIACCRHIDDTPARASYQTYGGHRTYLYWGAQTLRFPSVPMKFVNEEGPITEGVPEAEPSSGAFIEVRPMSNVKGLYQKVKAGPDAGKIYRPSLYLIDDPQTNDDANSEATVKKIISRIRRDALRGGSHSKRASAIMSITPVVPGDVAWHFEANEHSWDLIKYKMIEKFPDAHDWWMEEYARIYTNYDRSLRGDRTRAAMEAKALLEKNYEMAHEGAEVTWEHAYGWDEEPQTEISPVQHAYNIILDDGMEDFEYECQCNTEYGLYQEGETLHAPVIQIMNKVLPYKQNIIPQATTKLVAHIDINKDILTYVIASSPSPLQPHIVDYGSYPKQPGLFSKRKLMVPLRTLYPHLSDYRDVLYASCKELIDILATRRFIREDGNEITLNAIGVDIKYEEQYISRAIKECHHRPIVVPCSGLYVGADDEALHEKPKNPIEVYENAYKSPNRDHTLDILFYDTNWFKTEVHRGFNMESGMKGSLTFFGRNLEGGSLSPERHKPFAEHCNSERPEREVGKKTKRNRIIWKEKAHQVDNEYFDNITNCYALLYSLGIRQQIDPNETLATSSDMDMSAFLNNQRQRNLL